jgi:hypothetical protein
MYMHIYVHAYMHVYAYIYCMHIHVYFRYFYKGPDRAEVGFKANKKTKANQSSPSQAPDSSNPAAPKKIDEIKDFIDCRSVQWCPYMMVHHVLYQNEPT